MQSKADDLVKDAKQTADLLSSDRQALWSALRLSISRRFEYFCQLAPPSLVEPVAAGLDREMWNILEISTGDMVLTFPVAGLNNLSFQEWLVRPPVNLYGWGLRSI